MEENKNINKEQNNQEKTIQSIVPEKEIAQIPPQEENKNVSNEQNSSQPVVNNTQTTIGVMPDKNSSTNTNQQVSQTIEPIAANAQKVNLGGSDMVIGEVKPEKEASPILVIVVFGLLLGFAIGLPFFSEHITAYINSKKPIAQPVPNNPKEEEEEEEINNTGMVELNANTAIEMEDLTLNTFTFTTDDNISYINYQITAKDDNTKLADNLYIELFTEKKELLSRSKIYVKGTKLQDQKITLQSVVSSRAASEAKMIAIVEKNEEDIPQIELETQINGKQQLICTRNTHEMKYTFESYYLVEMHEKYTGVKGIDVNKYTEELSKYQEHILALEKIEGVSASLINSDTGFTMNNVFDMGTAKLDGINYPAYFEASTLAKVVKFDMESMGYQCK